MVTVKAKTVVVISLVILLMAPLTGASIVVAQGGASPAPVGLRPDAPLYALHGPQWVGTREFVIDPDSERPVPLLVWYPALNAEGADDAYTYSIQVKWEPGPELDTVVYGHTLSEGLPDLSGAPYPLVVVSPGAGTNAAQYTYLTEHLASHGFVVIGVEHQEGVYFMDENPFKDWPMMMIERPHDIRKALDFAETLTAAEGALAGMIDLEHVAVAGHSFGGTAALQAAGARIDIAAFLERCETGRAEGDPGANDLCWPLEPFVADMAALAGLDPMPGGLWPSLGDPRVDAAVTMAGDSYLFEQAGLAEITVPVLALGGTADFGTPFAWGVGPTYEYAGSAQKALVAFDEAGHTIFGNNCAAMPWLVDADMWWMCVDPVWEHLRTNDLINHFTTAFLLDVLKGDAEAHAALAPDAVDFPGIQYQAQGF